jgi:hypothetical protein
LRYGLEFWDGSYFIVESGWEAYRKTLGNENWKNDFKNDIQAFITKSHDEFLGDLEIHSTATAFEDIENEKEFRRFVEKYVLRPR